jgi:hypothetical protein
MPNVLPAQCATRPRTPRTGLAGAHIAALLAVAAPAASPLTSRRAVAGPSGSENARQGGGERPRPVSRRRALVLGQRAADVGARSASDAPTGLGPNGRDTDGSVGRRRAPAGTWRYSVAFDTLTGCFGKPNIGG